MKSGFVTIIGRPNAGKSTLLNSIMERKISIISNKPQTTRHSIKGIYQDSEYQIVFIDTPGIHKPKHKLGYILNNEAYSSLSETDLIILVMDSLERIGPGDRFLIEKIKNIDTKVILVLNKVDKVNKNELLSIIDECSKLHDFAEIVPISAFKGDNVDRLINVIKKYINDPVRYYDTDTITDKSNEFMISEYVREKILEYTKEEVPHAVTCLVERIEEKDNIYNIDVLIIVEREGLKKIIIGKNGSMIKNIGISSRKDIEELLGKQVYLNLYVKVVENWRDKEKYLKEFGF